MPGMGKARIRSVFSRDPVTLPLLVNGVEFGSVSFKKGEYGYIFGTINILDEKMSSRSTSYSESLEYIKSSISNPSEDQYNNREKILSRYVKAVAEGGDKQSDNIQKIQEDLWDNRRKENLSIKTTIFMGDEIGEPNAPAWLHKCKVICQGIESYEKSNGKIKSNEQLKSLLQKGKIQFSEDIGLKNIKQKNNDSYDKSY